MTINQRAVVAIMRAQAVLANEKDPLRIERAELQLQAVFSESQAKRVVATIQAQLVKAGNATA